MVVVNKTTKVILMVLLSFIHIPATVHAQSAAEFESAVIVGSDARTCDASIAGALRYATGAGGDNVTTDLVAHWRLDETSGTFADSSGNNNTGTQSGGVTFGQPGVIGLAAEFDGVSNQEIIVPHDPSLTPTEDMTVSFWVNPGEAWTSSDIWRLIDKQSSADIGDPGWQIYASGYFSGGIWFAVGDGAGNTQYGLSSFTDWDIGTWYHVTIVYEQNGTSPTVTFYRNGEFSNTDNPGSGFTPDWGTDDLQLGSGYFNNDLNGRLDDVRIYHTALTAADVEALYAGTVQACVLREVATVPCDTTPITYSTPGQYAYEVPEGCSSVQIQAYGAGGGGSASGNAGGAGGGGGSVVERTDTTLLAVGGGGGGGGSDRSAGGGGGGYGESIVSVASAETLNVWVGGGGLATIGTSGVDGADGGGVGGGAGGPENSGGGDSTYGGGGGSGDDAAGGGGGDSVYGGGGGVGKDNGAAGGGASTYGGGGGGGDGSGGGGASVNGRNGLNGDGGGGGGGGGFGNVTTALGNNGPTDGTGSAAAANSGPGAGGRGLATATNGGDGRVVITPLDDPCLDSPTPGTTCGDGTIYVGQSPDGDIPMFTTPADQGTFSWNDGEGDNVNTGMGYCWEVPSVCIQGASNTAYLEGLEATGPGPYEAAQECYNLPDHGHDDWYLPARQELELLSANRLEGDLNGTFSGEYYWSSSEQFNSAAYYVAIDDGGGGDGAPHFLNYVRCVRKGAPAAPTAYSWTNWGE